MTDNVHGGCAHEISLEHMLVHVVKIDHDNVARFLQLAKYIAQISKKLVDKIRCVLSELVPRSHLPKWQEISRNGYASTRSLIPLQPDFVAH